MKMFFDGAREGGKHLPPLQLSLDSGDADEERDSALICFYKERRDKSMWAAPFNCRILASLDLLLQLLKFWTGWEVPVKSLSLEVVQSRGCNHLPTASTL